MANTIQQLCEYRIFLLFSAGETKDYKHCTACIMKYGAIRKFSPRKRKPTHEKSQKGIIPTTVPFESDVYTVVQSCYSLVENL